MNPARFCSILCLVTYILYYAASHCSSCSYPNSWLAPEGNVVCCITPVFYQLRAGLVMKMCEMCVYQEMCHDVTTQECKQVPRDNCQDIVDQVCSTMHHCINGIIKIMQPLNKSSPPFRCFLFGS